ncbi:MAG TPA: bifunctional nicotinamide-nucleotide adenylyltransferase/Nudix hydroxylase [Aliidongia sp.]|uniref:bifunctional nicotinamide-nucleotide adenylyltransferase/Nudix hydroxylase n=1 Tax=Aliidongia sp. TaxID=1914230 RepID=UPI002DDD9D28|nr:bifunctional nicotinamide-nucleotide adenylyltransferase/Nudix hydroxylase [Aliidongia sp.]HEV2678592.1 bifunctional nicotinamide-nucleotide adenylyltransferase/Nudix hydroxylase [Aliidongia sp.]
MTSIATAAARPDPVSFRYDFMVFIGRFRFFQNGHLAVMRRALQLGQQLVILVGSARQARSLRNPLTFDEVRDNILGAFDEAERARISVLPLIDRYNDVEWVADVQAAVTGVACPSHPAPRLCLIGHAKDQSSYYLRMFPQWASEPVPNHEGLSATPMREDYLADAETGLAKWGPHMPPNVVRFLRGFARTEAYANLAEEAAFIADYKRKWAAAPYPPTFVTTDAVLVQSGHILLIERRNNPGKGLLALPGGFVDQHERIKDAMIRELREETRLKVPTGFLEGSVKATQVFDYPYRSARGRTISHAFLIVLTGDKSGLPKVRGSDDARRAVWMPIGDLEPERMFEDHWHIIRTMLPYASRG